jgi:hypothetical protein
MTKDEALKMAIKELKKLADDLDEKLWKKINKCEEALEQPLTRDWKETIDERIAKDDEFKRALEQPSVAELNDEYLRDTHVEGLSQPAQEPVAWMEVKKDAGFKCIEVWQEPVSKNSIPLYTHPAPSWQGNKEFVGLSDDEREILYDKAIEMPLENLWNDYAYLIEQALKDKNA